MKKSANISEYATVTAAYWGFTVTDGALRMLVLGHFHLLGYSPFQLASLFILYEAFGVITNLVGGWIGSRTGLRLTLLLGLCLQILALTMLSGLSSQWGHTVQVLYVIAAQGLSGIAKDFTKMSAKSAIKVLVPGSESGTLFKWVALLTGSKNTLKGVGFFLGGFALETTGFRLALWSMAIGLGLVFLASLRVLPQALGKTKKKHRFKETLHSNRAIKILSTARLFLFCSRDIWFVVGLPVYMSDLLGWSFLQIGTYMAFWVMGYGLVQATTPKLLPMLGKEQSNDAKSARQWGGILILVTLVLIILLYLRVTPRFTLVVGLAVFGCVFAVNSAIHSYLVLAYSDNESVSMNVGFYYMANAMGRFMGTILSGFLYQWGGIIACVVASFFMVMASSILTTKLPDPRNTLPTDYM